MCADAEDGIVNVSGNVVKCLDLLLLECFDECERVVLNFLKG